MADFFEELGKRISDVASDLGKKTEDTIEIQKIKGEIRSLKRANKFQKGEIPDTDYIDLCDNIEKREEEIERQEEEIVRIKEDI